ncbi:MAG TPA: GNAT family N-acetyltransferase [Solirubrobacterales bacterium]|nr:GNAT family N-acetyltransferase [Solirubrobacterales bacterium]
MTVIELEPFRAEHLQGVVALCAAEGWDTYTEDPERTRRALSSPGSTTLIAVDGGVVAGLIQLQSDGEIQAHLSALLVGEAWRAGGLARRLLREALERAGGMRMDILTAAEAFYLHLGAESKAGFRLRPSDLQEGLSG